MYRYLIMPAVLLAVAGLAMPVHAQSGLMNSYKTSDSVDGIDFGDNTSSFAHNDICDDPRFEGQGMTSIILEHDRMHDAADCRAAYLAGTVRLASGSSASAPAKVIAYGDNSSEWAHDGECDDPRFEGPGVATTLLEADRMADADDCRAAVLVGSAWLIGTAAERGTSIDFGDDSSRWANDGECDDARFEGQDETMVFVADDLFADASDCSAAFGAGIIRLRSGPANGLFEGGINFGDDSGQWVGDGECDDPRFAGSGMAGSLVTDNMFADASDCVAHFRDGSIYLR